MTFWVDGEWWKCKEGNWRRQYAPPQQSATPTEKNGQSTNGDIKNNEEFLTTRERQLEARIAALEKRVKELNEVKSHDHSNETAERPHCSFVQKKDVVTSVICYTPDGKLTLFSHGKVVF